jgi:hypothetical protein
MNQQDSDMLQIAIGSSEHFKNDIPTPAIPYPYCDHSLLKSIRDNPSENASPNTTPWHSGPDRALVEFYICRPGTKPPTACLDSEAILSQTFRNVRDIVFSNEFYLSTLQLAQADIAG